MTDHCNNALIVFIKNPVIGRVKTRLAATIGEKQALEIYVHLLSHTMSVAAQVNTDLVICYSDFVPLQDAWSSLKAKRTLQVGENLGESMHYALSEALKTHARAVLIGSDCNEITSEILEDAFNSLSHVDVVIGPATDGGYYLVGANQPVPEIFTGVDWSTEHVLTQSITRLLASGLNFCLGTTLADVDTEDDWRAQNAP